MSSAAPSITGGGRPDEDRGAEQPRQNMTRFGEVVAHVLIGRITSAVPGAWRGLPSGDMARIKAILAEEAERIERLGPPPKPRKKCHTMP